MLLVIQLPRMHLSNSLCPRPRRSIFIKLRITVMPPTRSNTEIAAVSAFGVGRCMFTGLRKVCALLQRLLCRMLSLHIEWLVCVICTYFTFRLAMITSGLSQRPRRIRPERFFLSRTLGSWVRIPLEELMFAFILCLCCLVWSPLMSGGQSSWLQIQRSGVDSRRY
jgi:hypothetical protein